MVLKHDGVGGQFMVVELLLASFSCHLVHLLGPRKELSGLRRIPRKKNVVLKLLVVSVKVPRHSGVWNPH